MSEPVILSSLSAIRLALMAKEVRAQTAPVLRADPIAVVGMACRTPGGGDTPDTLWRLLAAGATATGDIPADRFDAEAWYDSDPSAPGKVSTMRGGFLDRIDLFDADYFGILGREADQMDPQQRLALEAAIEAIDDAGASHMALRGSRAGVFMACYHSDYARLVYQDLDALDTRTLTGTVHGVVANRISHFLDLRGPSLTLDTGCSSSLVALHLACQSLRMGESDFALAGGVSVMITPELFVAMTKVGFMAPDGQCKTFDERADGFGRGEGCGMVALKRLSDAVADGDRVLAVIRGSAVNQDGRSTVLTAPNGKAQEALIRDALANAAVAPGQVAFVEAHGTGTALGDPLEVEALAAVLGAPAAAPCYIGSAKANIGHLEAAAGIVGLIKAVQALRHGEVPPQPDFGTLSPHISLAGTRLQVPTSLTPLPGAGPRCAAVSSFGIGGTNAHVILEEAPALPRPEPAPEGAAWVLPISAKTPQGLADLGRAWLEVLDDPSGASIDDLCYTASERRAHYAERLAAAGKDRASLRSRLAAALDGLDGRAPAAGTPRVGFVFSGQGAQWWAMGRELIEAEPVFRKAMEACDAAIRGHAGWSVIEELRRPEAESRVAETQVAQPALFALQVSLAALWEAWGVRPAAVTGHSVGEIAALHLAGALSLDEAARIIVRRGAIMQAATGEGRMASVSLTEAEARAFVADYGGRLDVAAVNAPSATVLSGAADALAAALEALAAKGVSARALHVDYAFHSAQMAGHAERFAAQLGAVAAGRPVTPVFSTLTGAALGDRALDAAYFAEAIRAPVRFADAIAAMADAGVDAFLEIGPHPVLTAAIADTLEDRPPRAIAASLRRGQDEGETIRSGLAALYAAGVEPVWAAVQPAEGVVTTLPAYPWRRRRHWLSGRRAGRPSAAAPSDWLGAPVQVAGAGSTVVPVDPAAIADWVGDHLIFGQVVVPGAAILQALSAAACAVMGVRAATLGDVLIREPLSLESGDERCQIVAVAQDDGQALSFYAQASISAPWRLVAEAHAAPAPAAFAAPSPFAGGAPADVAAFHAGLLASGVAFGPAFSGLSDAVCGEADAEGWAELPEGLAPTPAPHPALLDAGLQLAVLAAGTPGAFLPLGVDRATVDAAPCRRLRLRARVTSRTEASIAADVFAWDEAGAPVATLEGVRFVKASPARLADDKVYAIDWSSVPPAAAPLASEPAWIVLDDAGGTAEAFAAALRASGADVLRARPAREDVAAFVADLPAAFATAAVACFWPLDLDAQADDQAAYGWFLDLVHALARRGPRRLALVTRDAASCDAVGVDAAARGAGLAAMASVVALEHPDLDVRVLDLDPLGAPERDARALAAALAASAEPTLALRGEELRAPRLHRLASDSAAPARVVQTGEGLDGVALEPFTPREPGPGELRLRVLAAGLNFRDTLVALGAYPGGQAVFGGECAGVVEAVGPGARGFAVGDRVASLAQGCLATHAIVRADLSAPIPDGLTFAAAAAAPVAFLTADIGLRRLARLQPGERVLIHAATGGVGVAALALARAAGAEIFTTAGSPEKRAWLRALGIAHVFDSRSLDFADQILAATGGEGVRVVLNSLTGRFVAASLRALAPDGIFLELGKREIWTPQEVAAARPDVGYHVFDAGEMAEADPALFQSAVGEALAAVASGAMAASPLETRPLDGVQAALRRMAQARHIGKIVLTPAAGPADAPAVRVDGAYLVTGGFGGVGLQAAAWLVARGARDLVLASRSAPGEAALAAVAELERAGASVRTASLDICDADAVRGLLAGLAAPLRGIVHTAGVAADGLIRDLDAAHLSEARRGKVEGARVLRALTRGLPLDFVILCSSAAGLFGALGQGAYVAANAELEALAAQWRREGSPAVAVAWGPWAEGGMFAAASTQAQAAWRARGLSPMDADQAFGALERVLAGADAQAVVAEVDWTRAFAAELPTRSRALFSAFAPRAAAAATPRAEAEGDLARLRALPASLRRGALVEALAARARVVLDLPPDAPLPPAAPLKDFGLDSLMAVELRNHLARMGGASLPATLAFDHPTLDALADHLGVVWALVAVQAPKPAAPAADDLGDLSDAEAEAMLAAELEMLGAGAPQGRRPS